MNTRLYNRMQAISQTRHLPLGWLLVAALWYGPLQAVPHVSQLVLPVGTVVAGYSAEQANGMFLNNFPPFLPPVGSRTGIGVGTLPWNAGSNVVQTVLTTPMVYMRFYDDINSSPNGRWTTPAAAVRGLSPAQVKDGLALPAAPTMMAIGVAAVGVNAYTGTAGPIAGWGSGGLQQTFLNTLSPGTGTFSWVFNKQAIMDCILCYDRIATSRNTLTLGRYLTAHTPAAYSDMDSLYNVLDTLFIVDQAAHLNAALESMGAARFDDLMTAGSLAVLLQNRAVTNRVDWLLLRHRFPDTTDALGAPRPGDGEVSPGVWAKALGTNLNDKNAGFDSAVWGLVIGLDRRLGTSNVSGASLALLRGNLNWKDGGGNADTDYVRLGGYSVWELGQAFIQATANLGFATGDTSRSILISPNWTPPPAGDTNYNIPWSPYSLIARNAKGRYDGWDMDLSLRGGLLFRYRKVMLIPSLTAGYLYQSRNGFAESGAGGLGLDLARGTAGSFLARAEIALMREFVLGTGQALQPYLQLGLAYQNRLDDQKVSAALNDWPDRFQSYGPSLESTTLLAGVGMVYSAGRDLSFHLSYLYEGRNGYDSNSFAAGLSWRF